MALTEVDHVAIAVRDLDAAVDWYKETFGATVAHREVVERDGVEEALLAVADSYIQLLTPTRDDSTVAKFLDTKGEGIHHVGYRVADCGEALRQAVDAGARAIDAEPLPGIAGDHRRVPAPEDGLRHPHRVGSGMTSGVDGDRRSCEGPQVQRPLLVWERAQVQEMPPGDRGQGPAWPRDPDREIPAGIVPTDYYRTGVPVRRDEPLIKSPEVVDRMRIAGKVAAEVLAVTGAAVAPGVTTEELDQLAHRAYLERGAYPSTLNYHQYPKTICTSVNEVICHGIPDDRPLEAGDIVNLDITAYIARGPRGLQRHLLRRRGRLRVPGPGRDHPRVPDLGIEAVRPGRPLSDIGRAIQAHAEAHGYGVVRMFVGHGIGEQFHIAPSVPHYYTPDASTGCDPV